MPQEQTFRVIRIAGFAILAPIGICFCIGNFATTPGDWDTEALLGPGAKAAAT